MHYGIATVDMLIYIQWYLSTMIYSILQELEFDHESSELCLTVLSQTKYFKQIPDVLSTPLNMEVCESRWSIFRTANTTATPTPYPALLSPITWDNARYCPSCIKRQNVDTFPGECRYSNWVADNLDIVIETYNVPAICVSITIYQYRNVETYFRNYMYYDRK